MTAEEAIDELEVIHERLSHPEDCEQGVYSFRDGNYLEALDMAIKALEQQPCEDCISREQAIKQCGFGMTSLLIADCLRKLPSVTPTRPTGKWKKYLDERGFLQCECLKCGLITNEPDNYCPNCGADMRESEDNKDGKV